jgi:periplasmic divalent cation tolerance protein
MAEVGVVLVTAPDEARAAAIARTLVDEGLIACANLLPHVRSIYRWEGRVVDEPEVLLVMKIDRDAFERVGERVVQLHPYDVPEVICLDVSAGHPPYLQWVLAQTQSAGKSM